MSSDCCHYTSKCIIRTRPRLREHVQEGREGGRRKLEKKHHQAERNITAKNMHPVPVDADMRGGPVERPFGGGRSKNGLAMQIYLSEK